jgi:hypothetical protein
MEPPREGEGAERPRSPGERFGLRARRGVVRAKLLRDGRESDRSMHASALLPSLRLLEAVCPGEVILGKAKARAPTESLEIGRPWQAAKPSCL